MKSNQKTILVIWKDSTKRLRRFHHAVVDLYFSRGLYTQSSTVTWKIKSGLRIIHFIQLNQLHFYRANIPTIARLSGMTAESVFNSKIDEAVL